MITKKDLTEAEKIADIINDWHRHLEDCRTCRENAWSVEFDDVQRLCPTGKAILLDLFN